MRSFAVALFALALAPLVASAAEAENPYKNAKVGDTLSYKMTAPPFEGNLTQTITEKSAKDVTVKSDIKVLDMTEPTKTFKIDITKAFDPSAMGVNGTKVQKLKEGTEKIMIGDKEYDCQWAAYKLETPTGIRTPAGFESGAEIKIWFSKDVPGMVKMTSVSKVNKLEVKYLFELTAFTSKK